MAGTDCYCLRIPVDTIKRYLYKRPELLEELVGTAVHECGYLMTLYLARPKCRRQLRCVTGCSSAWKWMKRDVAICRAITTTISPNLLNLHKVTVSRIFSALRRDGVLEKNKQGFLVRDMKRLRAYAENIIHLKYS